MVREYNCLKNCCNYTVQQYSHEHKFRVVYSNKERQKAGIAIYDKKKNKLLLVQSRGHLWGIPKGTKKKDESIIDCAIREVYEETGLQIHKEQLSKYIKVHNKAIYYIIELDECKVRIRNDIIDNDVNGIGWFKLDCLMELYQNNIITLNRHCKILLEKLFQIQLSSK